ncbi:hypothetical protein GCM10011418_29150 [Sphingobacterium alkalisoli]|nr:hypothetical protein GCM10011418_29150 [Sphingobacterium alkalisoli]
MDDDGISRMLTATSLTAMDCVSYPKYEMLILELAGRLEIEKFPFSSVEVDKLVPTTVTVAPIMGSFVLSSVTFPLMLDGFWA